MTDDKSIERPLRILGIDPGTGIVGYGLIDVSTGHFDTITYGTIQTEPKTPLHLRLPMIFEDMQYLIKEYEPDVVAVEQLFFFKNAKTVMGVAQARGVILLTISLNDIEFAEYTPLQIKQTITGYGRADKREVQEMVTSLLELESIPKPDDAADALAIAVCHAHFLGY